MQRRAFAVLAIAVPLTVAAALGGAAAPTGQPDTFERLAQVRRGLVEVKAELGMYSCCIAPTCNFCALAAGMCPCADNVTTDTGVCGECYLGWQAGQGNVPGVDPGQVRPLAGEMLRQMYRLRAEATPDLAAGRRGQPGPGPR